MNSAEEKEDEALAAFIREAGELCEAAHDRVLLVHFGNVTCLATMGGVYLVADGASAARTGMIMLGLVSLPVMVAEAVRRIRRWRRK